MSVKMETSLRPFMVPTYAIEAPRLGKREDGLVDSPKYHLTEVPADVLSDLCDEFRAAVFAKARKADPKGDSRRAR